MDNLGAKIVADNTRDGAASLQIEIQGLRACVTGIIASQDQQSQHYGIEHIAITTNIFDADYGRLKPSGTRLLEERALNGTGVVWWEAPDGVQIELIERRGVNLSLRWGGSRAPRHPFVGDPLLGIRNASLRHGSKSPIVGCRQAGA